MIFKKVFLILLTPQILTILNAKITHSTIIEVRYSETDSMSYTHHSNYLKFYEIGRLSWFKNIGFSYKKLEETGVIMPVVDAKIKYKNVPNSVVDAREKFCQMLVKTENEKHLNEEKFTEILKNYK